MSQEQFEAFLRIYNSCYANSNILPKRLNNGTLHFSAKGNITSFNIQKLLLFLLSIKRKVHLNIGTMGEMDGTTIFWVSKAIKSKYFLKSNDHSEDKEEWLQKWYKGAQTVMNEDLQNIIKFMKVIQKTSSSSISITILSENNWPRYP